VTDGMADNLPPQSDAPVHWAAAWKWARRALVLGIPVLLIWLVWSELHALDIHKVRAVLADADPGLAALGIAAAFAAIFVMGFYDAVAFPRGVAGTLGFWKRWSLGAVLFGWTNFVSLGPFGGPALRILAYRRFGLTGPEITRGFLGHYLGTSAGLIAWLAAAWAPLGIGAVPNAGRIALALLLSVLLPIAVARIAVPLLRRHRYGAELDNLPLARLGVVSFFDWGLTLLSFWLLARAVGVDLEEAGAARTVFTGQFAGLLSMLPGGLGSADAVWFKGFDVMGVAHEAAAAAIVAFRGGFYLVPWSTALVSIYIYLASRSDRVRRWQRRAVAGAVMVNSILLLLSAATPALSDRLSVIAKVVPLGAIEASHALSVATAATMLFLVRGLLRGYRSAYLVAMVMLAASAIAHPLKGGDYEESFAALVLMVLLFGVRGAFTRRGRTPIGWELTIAAGIGAIALFLVSGLAAFERIPYRHDLWVTFADKAEASRFLRGGALLATITIAAILRQATRPVSLFVVPTEDEIQKAEAFAMKHADSADPLLVGGGDKGVWFYDNPKKPGDPHAMFLYQRSGDRVVVFKEPVIADGVDPAPAIDAFLRFCDDLDVEPVFSMITDRWMGQLHDFGFHFLKVAQEAVVPLEGFSLQGGQNAGFRRTLRDLEKAGVKFELLSPPFDDATIGQLRTVSDAWIAAKGGHELQFSACYFSPRYIQRHPVGVAREASGRIIAFVNILTTRQGGPATIDFMRYSPNVVDNLMDFVLIRSMQTAAEQGATSFSLGGAALSDVGVWRGSKLIERAMHVFSTKAESFYNYQGLLRYKAKFHPDWVPRYIAYQQPWDWAASLIANARLVEARGRSDKARIAAARLGSNDAFR
jgi:phosphatidylglycerol lysyltransferase